MAILLKKVQELTKGMPLFFYSVCELLHQALSQACSGVSAGKACAKLPLVNTTKRLIKSLLTRDKNTEVETQIRELFKNIYSQTND